MKSSAAELPREAERSNRSSNFDPIELEILWKRLISVVDEASAAFVRTCFSTLVRDGNDFAIVLTDAQGRSLAQSTMSLPGFIGCLPATVRAFLEKFPAETMKPGDVFITNDPYYGGVNGFEEVLDLVEAAAQGLAGLTFEVMVGAGLGPVNLEANVRFLRELRDGDEVDVTCEFGWGEGKTFRVRQQFTRPGDGELAAEVTTVSGVIDSGQRRLVADPAGRLRALAAAPEVMGL